MSLDNSYVSNSININDNILVIGDLIIDHNIYTKYNKIANEAPIPVFLTQKEEFKLGGSANVYKNILSGSLNGNVKYITVVGNNLDLSLITREICSKNLDNIYIVEDSKRTTSIKHRIFSENKLLFRYDEETTEPISQKIEDKILQIIHNIRPAIITMSDYDKGVMTFSLCQKIIEYANKNGIITMVDPKGNYYKYKNCTILKPNKNEVKNFLKINNLIDNSISGEPNNIDDYHYVIHKELCLNISIITQGESGLSLCRDNNSASGGLIENDIYECPASKKQIIDVTGAGDIVLALFSLLYTKVDLNFLCSISVWIASKSVECVGTYLLTRDDISSFIVQYDKTVDLKRNMRTKIISKNITLQNYINLYPKLRGKRIVFTNGCFDVFHSGHAFLLTEARKLGDILVVGLNSDQSIKQNKGDNRPINTLGQRLDVLTALSVVDYVIVFDEKTPLDIIKVIKPDVLVKGDDYNLENVVGKEYAKSVVFIQKIPGISSTNIISKSSGGIPVYSQSSDKSFQYGSTTF